MQKYSIIQNLLTLGTCIIVLSVIAVRKENRLFQHDFAKEITATDTLSVIGDTIVVHTAPLAEDVQGYAGRTPLDIYVAEGKVTRVVALPNDETPGFWKKAVTITEEWIGKDIGEAAETDVDAVSGATFSSEAIKENARRGLAYAAKQYAERMAQGQAGTADSVTPKSIAALAVLLMAMIIPLFIRSRKMHTIQLILNVSVLGLWSGTFISHTMLVSIAANGIHLPAMAASALMLVSALLYPLFGKKGYYCTHICPLGSAQELIYRIPGTKIQVGQTTIQYLVWFRRLLWAVLTCLLITDVWSEWTDYEPFSAFLLSTADPLVIALAATILLAAILIPRPFCRFVCPTGTLLKMK